MSDVSSPSPHPADARHLLVIGVGPGIGAATARRFTRDGYRVTLVARHRDKLEELAADLRSTGAQVAVVRADAADPGQLREALSSLYAAPNPPGVVLYNVAQVTPDDLLSAAPEDLLGAHTVDVVGGVVAAQVAVPAMRAAGGGTLLFTGGGLADQPHPGLATLSLGKLGLRGVANLLGAQLAEDGIRVRTLTVNGAVAPGTPFDPGHIAERYRRLVDNAEPGFVDEHFNGP
ncbi:MAG TPA: SDR family NAD(P)-dependent oxidoreductase [Jatrophihabitantaceae bacterium]|nr:SDR family NAD(P)-dependent oxidoreductase [Jatrophihabitantaceae bacterium]